MIKTVRSLDVPWTAHEIPVPLLVQMFQTEKDLSGWNLQMRMSRDGVELTPAAGTPVEWSDVTKGIVQINFGDGDMDVAEGAEFSTYEIEVWASGGGQRLASMTILNSCYQNVGTAPSI